MALSFCPAAVRPTVVVTGVFPLDGVTVNVPLVLHALDNVTLLAPASYTSPRVTELTRMELVPVLEFKRTSALLPVLLELVVTTRNPFILLTVSVVTPSANAETVKESCWPFPVMPTVVEAGVDPGAVTV